MVTSSDSSTNDYGPFSQTCGLNAAGDIYCIVATGSPPNYAYSLQQVDVGVPLKRFSGACGIGVDDKAYCWSYKDMKAKLVLGQ